MTIFSVVIEYDKHRGTNNRRPQGFLKFTVEAVRSILWDVRECRKHNFLKKAIFPVGKRFRPKFSRIIDRDERQGTTYKGTQGI